MSIGGWSDYAAIEPYCVEPTAVATDPRPSEPRSE